MTGEPTDPWGSVDASSGPCCSQTELMGIDHSGSVAVMSGVGRCSVTVSLDPLGLGMVSAGLQFSGLWCVGRRYHLQGALGQTWTVPSTLVNSILQTGPDPPKHKPSIVPERNHLLSFDLPRLQWMQGFPVRLSSSSSYFLSHPKRFPTDCSSHALSPPHVWFPLNFLS